MAKIYISSTFTDLKDYRNAVIQALRKAGHFVEAMEDYVATGKHPPLTKCLADVEACEYYVGIFAWRYGYIPTEGNPEGRAITELEYRKAQELDKPCFIFLLDPEVPWSPKFIDSATGEGEQGKRINELRKELGSDKLASFFKTPDELATLVTTALSRWQKEAVHEENIQIIIQAFDLENSDVLFLDSWSIELINITLEAARKRYKAGRLTPEQITEFEILKKQVQDLLIVNKRLRFAAQKARQLLKQTRESIQADLEKLRSSNSNQLQEENEILKQFQDILEAGKEAADWLDANRDTLVKKAAKIALDAYPENRDSANSETIDDFEWELEKYLKRMSHCLIWSNYALIDEPDGLKAFPLYIHQAAIKYIRDKRIEQNPPDVSSTAIALLLDCFEHLIRRLS